MEKVEKKIGLHIDITQGESGYCVWAHRKSHYCSDWDDVIKTVDEIYKESQKEASND